MGAAQADRPKAQTLTRSPSSTTSTTITTTPGCVTPTNDTAVEGRRAFIRMNCYSCHGATGHGGGMGPSLVGVESGDVSEAVLKGEDGGMPSFKNNLCPNDVANLTAYLQLLGTGTEPTFVNWWEPNPSR
ncbi:MAG: c-type cytochrome [Methylococcaceae bacterium]|nr:c-type cytochrome [Methylococcaceae bacterium]